MSKKVQNPGHFLAGIAGLIRNRSGAYLLMKRSEDNDFGAEVWECVTGRVNQHEGFEAALHREVKEETGLDVSIDLIVGLSHFYRGEITPENELQGVAFGCRIVGEEKVVRSSEHTEHRWMSGDDALTFLTERDPGTLWLRQTIQRAEVLYAAQSEEQAKAHASGVTLD